MRPDARKYHDTLNKNTKQIKQNEKQKTSTTKDNCFVNSSF